MSDDASLGRPGLAPQARPLARCARLSRSPPAGPGAPPRRVERLAGNPSTEVRLKNSGVRRTLYPLSAGPEREYR